jgi:hypothetical protein
MRLRLFHLFRSFWGFHSLLPVLDGGRLLGELGLSPDLAFRFGAFLRGLRWCINVDGIFFSAAKRFNILCRGIVRIGEQAAWRLAQAGLDGFGHGAGEACIVPAVRYIDPNDKAMV